MESLKNDDIAAPRVWINMFKVTQQSSGGQDLVNIMDTTVMVGSE